jgi:hypothetical protein
MVSLKPAVFSFAVLLGTVSLWAQQPKLTSEELVTRHLESIGTPKARTDAKSRMAQGSVRVDMLVGGAAHSEGSGMVVSRGRQLIIGMNRFQDAGYPDEQFMYDGKEVRIGLTGPSTRSRLGDWLYREESLLRDGLLGGSLSTSWALLDVRGRQAKLRYEGLKKVDGRELHDLVYFPRKADAELTVHLYFEPETFRHVKSVYTFAASRGMTHLPEQQRGSVRSAAQDRSNMRYRLEETFGDFQSVDGITVPRHWQILFTVEADKTVSMRFDFNFAQIVHNTVVD